MLQPQHWLEHLEAAGRLIQGDDEADVRSLFGPAVSELLSQRAELCVEAHGDFLLTYRYGELLTADELRAALAEGLELMRLLEK